MGKCEDKFLVSKDDSDNDDVAVEETLIPFSTVLTLQQAKDLPANALLLTLTTTTMTQQTIAIEEYKKIAKR